MKALFALSAAESAAANLASLPLMTKGLLTTVIGLLGVFLVLAVLGAAYAGWHSRSWGLGLGVFAVCCAAILVLFWLRSAALTSAFSSLLGALCLFSPFETFVSGLFSLSAVVYYLSVTALFLFFTCQTLEKRRWN